MQIAQVKLALLHSDLAQRAFMHLKNQPTRFPAALVKNQSFTPSFC